MRRDTLLDFFSDVSAGRGTFLVYDDGYRARSYSYGETANAARGFAARLQSAGLGKGDKVVFWSENRPEWIIALWGCLLNGSIAVPIDYRASHEFLGHVARIVEAKLLLLGDDVEDPRQGKEQRAESINTWRLSDIDFRALDASAFRPVAVTRDDVVEIIFTSGATAEPKGVVLTHRNVLANIVPVEKEIRKYRKYGRPFFPIRFLNLLPLSHMFGQAMATFVPPMLQGTVVFMRGHNPHEIVRQVKTRRISVLVSVPKILDVLADHVARLYPDVRRVPGEKESIPKRWWRYRAVHRLLGLKFWSFVVGAAPLESSLESFWGRLGFVVVQGYGLTETAPIVTLNHPFSTSKGSVGKPIAGVDIRIAPDGEILVRGENVTTGYYGAPQTTDAAFEGRLVPHGRYRTARRGRPALHPRTQERNDRDAGRTQRVPRRRGARRQRRSRCQGLRRGGGDAERRRTRPCCARCRRGHEPVGCRQGGQRTAERSPAHSRGARLAGRRAAANRRHEETETS